MKTILFATDLSVNSKHAIEYAHQLLKDVAERYIIFYSYVDPSVGGHVSYPFEDVMNERSKEALDGFTKELEPLLDGREVEQFVRFGDMPYAVRGILDEENVDLIVMGSSGSGNALFGSTAYASMKELETPVLTVPLQTPVRSPARIALATEDILTGEEPYLEPVYQLVRLHDSWLMGLRVLNERVKEKMGEVQEHAFGSDRLPYMEIDAEDPAVAIAAAVGEHEIEMLVLPLEKKGLIYRIFHRSVTKELASELRIPIIALHR